MGLPNINITFKSLGISAVKRSQKGTVAMILKDEQALGQHTLTGAGSIPATLSLANREYVRRTFTGYVNVPRQVLLYVLDAQDGELQEALDHFALQRFDYLVGMPDIEPAEVEQIHSWVKQERANDHMVKAVLPNAAVDSEAVINFTSDNIIADTGTYSATEYCSRIAGLIAGTPVTISCTYAPLPEVADVERKTKTELDYAIERGEFVIFHDGEKVKVGRGVNSLVTITQEKGRAFQKIKIVEAMDMIKNDIRMTAQDNYIGKYANSYDNKCLLIMAIKGYLEELERSGMLELDTSVVEIDMEAQEIYLRERGIDTTQMTQQEIKEANTGSQVFLKARVNILDAIEDIDIAITI